MIRKTSNDVKRDIRTRREIIDRGRCVCNEASSHVWIIATAAQIIEISTSGLIRVYDRGVARLQTITNPDNAVRPHSRPANPRRLLEDGSAEPLIMGRDG